MWSILLIVQWLLLIATSHTVNVAWAHTVIPAAPSQAAVKAEYFFLVARLASWPGEHADGIAGFTELCVLGDDVDLYESLRMHDGQPFRGSIARIRQAHRTSFLKDCVAVFISRTEESILREVIQYFSSKPVLTVSDIPGFANRGGMIELIDDASRVRFAANPWCAARVGIEIDPRLLELAVNVMQLDEGDCP